MQLKRPEPMADQANTLIRQRILSGDYEPGGRLPSESELSQELGISRATLRTALAKLATEGLILRKQGDGTFVNQRLREVNASISGVLDFWQLIEVSGYQPSIKTLSITERGATPQEAEHLGIEIDSPVLFLKRLFFADQQPFIIAHNTIAKESLAARAIAHPASDEGQSSDSDPYNGRLPLSQFIEQYCQRKIGYAIYDIQSTLTTEEESTVLERLIGTGLLKLTATFYTKNNEALVFGTSYYDDSVLRLRFVQSWR